MLIMYIRLDVSARLYMIMNLKTMLTYRRWRTVWYEQEREKAESTHEENERVGKISRDNLDLSAIKMQTINTTKQFSIPWRTRHVQIYLS